MPILTRQYPEIYLHLLIPRVVNPIKKGNKIMIMYVNTQKIKAPEHLLAKYSVEYGSLIRLTILNIIFMNNIRNSLFDSDLCGLNPDSF